MMRLDRLLGDRIALSREQAAIEIADVADDSREVKANDLFFAIAGLTVDGHDFAQRAVDAGAAAVVCQRPLDLEVPCLQVDDPAELLGIVAARLNDSPGDALRTIGITGTNGKTTTAYLCEAICQQAGWRTGLLGTVAYRIAAEQIPAPYTTPTAIVLQRLLKKMVAAQCDTAIMEISSHALEQRRVAGLSIDVAAFSHITQDHLDLHGDMKRYLAAKLLLFSSVLRSGGTAVVNVDGDGADVVQSVVADRGDLRLLRCSRQRSDVEAVLSDWHSTLGGSRGRLTIAGEQVDFSSPLVGDFNADNLLLAATCCFAAGLKVAQLPAGIAQMPGVPGRLQRIDQSAIFVDYAHTPDALKRAIAVLRPLCRGRLLVVFGCGGDRDQQKRPLMARAVADGADLAIVTSDNPRSESPQAIIAQIVAGLPSDLREVDGTAARGYWVEADRQRAIEQAVAALGPDDALLIAGKGHEDYQIVGDRRLPFDDREQARRALAIAAAQRSKR
ncbi:MAG: UDP-N-acetylmuramoyl-L-alanyl-D-glutamate--2,6-diaminopimelate ligase [Deltaproteobacteria bacterium]|nr:UDP-N-acetylmuramoyl-L-alanyl-D-glutamate--2,6-diaminopimelate ligase [Deltaproteobacteria bacterium]